MIEKITIATGVKSVIKGLTDDCGCDDRKEKLNRMFPFHSSMTEEQKKVWEGLRVKYEENRLTAEEQTMVNALYNTVFRANARPTRCASCMVRRMTALEDVYQLCVS